MKKITLLLAVSVLAFLLGVTSVFAILPENTTVTIQSTDATYVTSVVTASAQGGNITNMSLNQTIQSSYWHAFYGDVVKHIFLADSGASNLVYDWGAQNLGGWVYFTNATGIDWTAVVAGDATDRQDEDASLGLTGDPESVNSTFTDSTHPAIADVGGTIGANSAVGVNTNSNGGSSWDTVLLRGGAAANDAAIYAGSIQQENENYRGELVDYQLIVPVSQGTGLRTYNVYAGLE